MMLTNWNWQEGDPEPELAAAVRRRIEADSPLISECDTRFVSGLRCYPLIPIDQELITVVELDHQGLGVQRHGSPHVYRFDFPPASETPEWAADLDGTIREWWPEEDES
jgi:hypothetical protein